MYQESQVVKLVIEHDLFCGLIMIVSILTFAINGFFFMYVEVNILVADDSNRDTFFFI